MEDLVNFSFKINPAICEYEEDSEQIYEAFKSSDNKEYIICWEIKNGIGQVSYNSEFVLKAIKDGDWIIHD